MYMVYVREVLECVHGVCEKGSRVCTWCMCERFYCVYMVYMREVLECVHGVCERGSIVCTWFLSKRF